MIVKRREIERLSADVRRMIDGEALDIRDHLEGSLSILKNDIHTLASRLNEQADNLQKEKAALADTLADISHQLKTPLTAMMVMVELLEEAPAPKQAEFIANLKRCFMQTGWLVDALLKMAKLESGSVTFHSLHVTASALLDMALGPLQILLDIKDQKVNLSGEISLNCDKNWTAEALSNLIRNASEHAPAGSVIEVAAGANPLCGWIAVTDAGEGIPLTKTKALFRRFEGSRHGTGIGLPLALAIMQGQNGDIEVEGGGNGIGATFTMKFYLG